tara:strand:- start:39346 stop:40032 length:687 start_codon:yes stop_codon:yes gene_type:complete
MVALLWMIYLMGATVVMFSTMSRAHTISSGITRPAARTMLILIVIGFCVLYPMLRLSQRHPTSGNVWFALRDAFVLFVPLQAVLWPQVSAILASWSFAVIAGVSLFFGCWMILIAGMLALAMRSIAYNDNAVNRGVWIILFLAIVLAAPAAGLLGDITPPAPIDQPRIGWLLSPLTGVLELVRDREQLGVSTKIYPQQIRMMLAIGCVGLALLLIARALEVAHARVRA